MNSIIIVLTFFSFQTHVLQEPLIVHLRPHSNTIQAEFGGKHLILADAPPVVTLPPLPLEVDSQGRAWFIDVENRGPNGVTIKDALMFSVHIQKGQKIEIRSTGKSYFVSR